MRPHISTVTLPVLLSALLLASNGHVTPCTPQKHDGNSNLIGRGTVCKQPFDAIEQRSPWGRRPNDQKGPKGGYVGNNNANQGPDELPEGTGNGGLGIPGPKGGLACTKRSWTPRWIPWRRVDCGNAPTVGDTVTNNYDVVVTEKFNPYVAEDGRGYDLGPPAYVDKLPGGRDALDEPVWSRTIVYNQGVEKIESNRIVVTFENPNSRTIVIDQSFNRDRDTLTGPDNTREIRWHDMVMSNWRQSCLRSNIAPSDLQYIVRSGIKDTVKDVEPERDAAIVVPAIYKAKNDPYRDSQHGIDEEMKKDLDPKEGIRILPDGPDQVHFDAFLNTYHGYPVRKMLEKYNGPDDLGQKHIKSLELIKDGEANDGHWWSVIIEIGPQ